MPVNYKDDVLTIHVLCFASDGRAVFYSGKIDGLFKNWERAENFSKENNMRPIHYTEGGLYLSEPDRYKVPKYGITLAEKIWTRASRLYCNDVYGDVQTFICCSRSESIFRTAEINQLLRNTKINTINGKPREYYQEARKRAFHKLLESGIDIRSAAVQSRDAAYRRIAAQELRNDFQKAAASNDNAVRDDAVVRARELGKQVKVEFARALKPSASAVRAERQAAFEEMAEANPHLLAAIAKNIAAHQAHAMTHFRM